MLKVRMKISYTAFLKCETINELFLKQISKSFDKFYPDYYNEQDEVMYELIKGKADLKCMVWVIHHRLLEKVFNFPKMSYQDMMRYYS